jgi:Protein of unknown function (DUF819)
MAQRSSCHNFAARARTATRARHVTLSPAPKTRRVTTYALLSDPWGAWAALGVAGAAGLWSQEHTRWGKELSVRPINRVCLTRSPDVRKCAIGLLCNGTPGCETNGRHVRPPITHFCNLLQGALVATLIGLALSNVGVTSPSAPQYNVVNSFLLPMAIPLLLFTANLRDVVRDTGAPLHHRPGLHPTQQPHVAGQ